MANFIFWSDLHQEFQPFALPSIDDFPVRPDGVLLAGDTDTQHRHLAFAQKVCEAYDCPVVLVDGNHEPYGQALDSFLAIEAEMLREIHRQGYPVHLLHGDAVEIAGTRIVGATLWTDFELEPAFKPFAMRIARRGMRDYHVIRLDESRPLTPTDTAWRHSEEKARILQHLDTPHDGPTVVMTHHLPIREAIHPQYRGHTLNAAFASDLLNELLPRQFHSWIFGHTHAAVEPAFDTETGTRQFLSNPRGYPEEATTFDPLRMLRT